MNTVREKSILMGGPNKANTHKNKQIKIEYRVLFQDVGLDHIALCDKQEVETVRIMAAPPGKVLQSHT